MNLAALIAELSPIENSTAPEILAEFGKDWSGICESRASLVVFPRSTEEVSRVLSVCQARGVAVVPSGGRTGLSGGAIAANGEVVLSLTKMNQVVHFDPQGMTVQVQAGMVTEALHHYLEPHGLTWPVDFASKGSSTVGGNIATNAGGVNVIYRGSTRNWVLGLTVVLMSGEVLQLNGALEKNNTGLDLKHLFIGSEGTLGVVTEARLKCAAILPESKRQVGLASFGSFESLLKFFRTLRETSGLELFAFECLTRLCLREVERLGVRSPIQNPGEVIGLFEFSLPFVEGSPDEEAFWEKLASVEGAEDIVLAQSPREKKEFWSVRERVAESVLLDSYVHQQDLSVPVEHLLEYVSAIERKYRENYSEFEVFIFGHIGDGNLHIFIRKPAGWTSDRFEAFCAESDQMLFRETAKYAGSVSAEHGIGLHKKPALSYSRTPEELRIFRDLKRVFDPKNLLNPGKIFDLG